jgi:hypothetical protein
MCINDDLARRTPGSAGLRPAQIRQREAIMKNVIASHVLTGSALLLCVACASAPENTADYHAPKVYRTGSAIAVRDYGAMWDVKVVDPASLRRELDGATRPTPASMPAGGGR